MDLIRTTTTYATPENAQKALEKMLRRAEGLTLQNVRWLIAVAPDPRGLDRIRYVPVIVGAEHVQFIHVGITVVG